MPPSRPAAVGERDDIQEVLLASVALSAGLICYRLLGS